MIVMLSLRKSMWMRCPKPVVPSTPSAPPVHPALPAGAAASTAVADFERARTKGTWRAGRTARMTVWTGDVMPSSRHNPSRCARVARARSSTSETALPVDQDRRPDAADLVAARGATTFVSSAVTATSSIRGCPWTSQVSLVTQQNGSAGFPSRHYFLGKRLGAPAR